MVRSVRDRLPGVRPVADAKAWIDSGRVSAITPSSARLRFDSSLAKLSGEVNQIFGSPALGFSSPLAIYSVRALMSSYEAIPTFSVFMTRLNTVRLIKFGINEPL